MDVSLKILTGSKAGAKLRIKKSKFTIGRHKSCSLTAAHSAISRQHCLIRRDENKLTIKDMGSRNGTLVNGEKITGEVALKTGDELEVGPLRFQVRMSTGLKSEKKPKVKSVAEAVGRAADTDSGQFTAEDITNWLTSPASAPASALNETQTIQLDDTNAIQAKSASDQENQADDEQAEVEEGAEDSEGKPSTEPGKLPPVPQKPVAKNSGEAASDALRAWSRRK